MIVEVAVLIHPAPIALAIVEVEATTAIGDKPIVWPPVTSQGSAHQTQRHSCTYYCYNRCFYKILGASFVPSKDHEPFV
jgi:hypothetical protein